MLLEQIKYKINNNINLCYDENRGLSLSLNSIISTVNEFNFVANKIWLNLTEPWVVGLRMPDSVSDIIANTLINFSDGTFMKNPDEKGFPDLIPLHENAKEFIKNNNNRSSIYKNFGSIDGVSVSLVPGIEAKATMISSQENKKNRKMIKIDNTISPKWFSHYPTTVNLLAVAWDFGENGNPFIVGVWFSKLEPTDWTKKTIKISGRTTPCVSTATKSAKEKLGNNCVLVVDDERYLSGLYKFHSKNSFLNDPIIEIDDDDDIT